jgi:segregation and condensation protein B
MDRHDLVPLLEALLFAADQPLSTRALLRALGERDRSAGEVKEALEGLRRLYDEQGHGFKLVRLATGYQVVTRARYEPWVRRMLVSRHRARLSRAGLETVAVIAYKQPITRMEIERIRGVDVGGVLNTLLERGLILIRGRDAGPGRPLLYGTTSAFLDYFGISKLSDLPRMEEIAALARTEAGSEWDEGERARFERHGVEAENVPPPDREEDREDPAQREEDREAFRAVASGFAETAASVDPGEPEPRSEEPETDDGEEEPPPEPPRPTA